MSLGLTINLPGYAKKKFHIPLYELPEVVGQVLWPPPPPPPPPEVVAKLTSGSEAMAPTWAQLAAHFPGQWWLWFPPHLHDPDNPWYRDLRALAAIHEYANSLGAGVLKTALQQAVQHSIAAMNEQLPDSVRIEEIPVKELAEPQPTHV